MNESLSFLDGLVGCSVRSRTVAAEPAEPQEGAAWLLPVGRSGPGWTAHPVGTLLRRQDGAWLPLPTPAGALLLVEDEGALLLRVGDGWRPVMAADADGRVRLPGQPAFGVFRGEARTVIGRFTNYLPLSYSLNRGGGFDTAAGLFTAPLAGAYAFHLTGRSYTDVAARAVFVLEVDGVALEEWIETYGPYQDVGGGAVLNLPAGAQVGVRTVETGAGQSVGCFFSGHFVG